MNLEKSFKFISMQFQDPALKKKSKKLDFAKKLVDFINYINLQSSLVTQTNGYGGSGSGFSKFFEEANNSNFSSRI